MPEAVEQNNSKGLSLFNYVKAKFTYKSLMLTPPLVLKYVHYYFTIGIINKSEEWVTSVPK